MPPSSAAISARKRKQQQERRQKLEKKAKQREEKLDKWLAEYDANDSGQLSKEETRSLLTDIKRKVWQHFECRCSVGRGGMNCLR